MSPSQLLGEPITVDCDLWALAATAVAMLLGRSPFESDNPSLTIVNTLQGETPRPTVLCPGVAPDLDVWAQIAFSRQAHERFVSATELAVAFADAARGDLGFSFADDRPIP
jgi:serine/threonine-protein kinase